MLSVVVPVLNEEETLPELSRRLRSVLQAAGLSYEVIFVDDASTDGSLDLLREFSRQDSRISYISLTRTFGQAAALAAGQRAARGLGVLTIDADLQNPPEDIPALLQKFDEGFDIVYGVRRNRQDSWFRKSCSTLMARLLQASMHVSLRPDVSTFMIAHRRIVDQLNRCPERTRFHPAICAWLGGKTAHVEVGHAARSNGASKYGFGKLLVRAIDLLTSFTHFPLRLASWIGVIFALFGFSLAAWAILSKLLWGQTLLGWPSTLAAIGLLGGVQLLTIGVLGEYLGRAYTELLDRPLYVIRESGGRLSQGAAGETCSDGVGSPRGAQIRQHPALRALAFQEEAHAVNS